MTCKTAICDDCASDIEYLTSLITAWAEASGHMVTVKAFPSAESFLFQYEVAALHYLMKPVALKNGEEIPISRGMAEEIRKAIIRIF